MCHGSDLTKNHAADKVVTDMAAVIALQFRNRLAVVVIRRRYQPFGFVEHLRHEMATLNTNVAMPVFAWSWFIDWHY
jgi:hypothetical protein